MSLNFDLSAVKQRLGDRWDEITTSPDTLGAPEGEQRWHAVTDFLIWASLEVDLGDVTEKNVDEWCFRLGLLRLTTENFEGDVRRDIGDFKLNRNDIVNHIGMRTNVTTKTRANWLARIFKTGSFDEKNVLKITGFMPTQEPSAAERVNTAYAAYAAKQSTE